MTRQDKPIGYSASGHHDEGAGAWKLAASGAAVGGFFVLSLSLLLAGFFLAPALGDLGGFDRRLQIVGAAGCAGSLLACLASVWPTPLKRLATILIGVGFVGALAFATINLGRDLTLNSYNIRSHPSFALSEIAAVSPAGNERTNYRIFYTLHDRIAGGELLVHPDFPLGDWHMLYRGDLARVQRIAAAELPPAPSAIEVERWIEGGGLDLTTTDGKRFVLSPAILKQAPVHGARYAIVKVDNATYALVAAQSLQSQ